MLYSIGKDLTASCCTSRSRRSIRRRCLFRYCMSTRLGNFARDDRVSRQDRRASRRRSDRARQPGRLARGINPIASGSSLHTQVMKTDALKQALDLYGFDAAFGGARRDEEKSRAKERIFSFRSPGHVWDPRNQRPELWNLFNTRIRPGETMRVFPAVELDRARRLAIHHAGKHSRSFRCISPSSGRSSGATAAGSWSMTSGSPWSRTRRRKLRRVRFRTLGCYPLSGAIESDAVTIEDIVGEMQMRPRLRSAKDG